MPVRPEEGAITPCVSRERFTYIDCIFVSCELDLCYNSFGSEVNLCPSAFLSFFLNLHRAQTKCQVVFVPSSTVSPINCW